MIRIAMIAVIESSLEARSSLSNCPPYSILYPSGIETSEPITFLISFTTLIRSRF